MVEAHDFAVAVAAPAVAVDTDEAAAAVTIAVVSSSNYPLTLVPPLLFITLIDDFPFQCRIVKVFLWKPVGAWISRFYVIL